MNYCAAYISIAPKSAINKIRLKRRYGGNSTAKFVYESGPIRYGIYADSQDALNCIEYVFDWSINWVIRCTECKSMTCRKDKSGHVDIMMRTQVVHNKTISSMRRPWSNVV